MNTERDKKAQSPLTGRRYNSVDEFMAGESISPGVRDAVSQLDRDTVVVEHLVQARRDAGLTQQQMAEKLHKSQGAISKLESSNDNEITLEEISEYAGTTNQNFSLMIGKPMNHIEMVKYHAYGIKHHLSALAKEAHRNEEAE
jgi:transcriptional regulator with XRE-family HTH domain